MPAGRPTLYRDDHPERARKLALLGMTDEEIAESFGISHQTFYNWQDAHPEFLEAINAGKAPADAEVAASLYHRARGYSHPDVHVALFNGEAVITPLVKHYPPDTTAASLWLRNRQSARWRDRTENANQQLDKNGQPMDPVVPVVQVTFSDG
jgi:hypothetical protein